MKKITAIRANGGGKGRAKVFLDDKFAFSLKAEAAMKEGLQVGQELSDGQIEALTHADHFHRCLDAALHYLSYRPRSELELRERLERRGFEGDSIEAAIARLKKQGMVDDMAFAQFWKNNRESFSPRSQRMTKLELKRKGVADDIIAQTVDTDDDESAYQAALSKARRLPLADYQSFHRRLGEYLKRRGFGYGVITATVKRIWQERGGRFEDSALP